MTVPVENTPPTPPVCALRLLAPPGFDTPCWCGHASSNCTQKEDGTCD